MESLNLSPGGKVWERRRGAPNPYMKVRKEYLEKK